MRIPSMIKFIMSLICFAIVTEDIKFIVREAAASECWECHSDIYAGAINRTYVHSPFAEKNCGNCHIEETSSDTLLNDPQIAPVPSESLEWIGQLAWAPVTSQSYLLSGENAGNDVWIDVWSGNERIRMECVRVPAIDGLDPIPDDLVPPRISALRVDSIEKTLFVTVDICWTTDEYADSMVVYGIEGADGQTCHEQRLTLEHHVRLSELKINQTYRYYVVSRDVAGNFTTSAPETFTLVDTDITPETQTLTEIPVAITIEIRFFRAGENYVLNITSDQPVIALIGLSPTDSAADAALPSAVEPEAAGHPSITVFDSAGCISRCLSCHTTICPDGSHPMDVVPKPDMTFPADCKLIDGKITCVSCHAIHSSDHEFRLIADRQDLCRGCHRGY